MLFYVRHCPTLTIFTAKHDNNHFSVLFFPAILLLIMQSNNTTLNIDRATKISDIQEWFTGRFAFLKLEFFRNRHLAKKEVRGPGELALRSDVLTHAKITIDGKWTVIDVENLFLTEAGLYVQILRRSGNLWIETTFTEDWTLDQQNHEGEMLSAVYTSPADLNKAKP